MIPPLNESDREKRIKVESMEQISPVLANYNRRMSNDYLLPNQYNKLIQHGKLSFFADGHAIYIFEEREGFTKMYFRLLDISARICNTVGCIATNIVYKGSSEDSAQNEWLKRNGFILRYERVRYSTDKLQIDSSYEPIMFATAEEAYPVYMRSFDAVSADLPCKDMFEGAFCIRNDEGAPIGVLSMGNDRHIAVLPEYRGKGIATRLYRMLAQYYKGYQLRIWTDKDNKASNALYQRLGFRRDDMSAKCYVKENN